MNDSFLALTLEAVGSVLIGWAALSVHHRVLNEHRIDKRVIHTMQVEQKLGALGIVLVILGYLFNIVR
jgi:hypothetical protein